MIDSVFEKIYYNYYEYTKKYKLNHETPLVGNFQPIKKLAPYDLNK